MIVEITLTPAELLIGSLVGSMRNVENIKKGTPPAYGAGLTQSWQLDILGALGEMVVAKHLNLYWSKGEMHDDDVGSLQVRTASPGRRLIIHESDADEKKFYFVTGQKDKFVIHGWLHGWEGKQQKWWRDPTGGNRYAYFVPASNLHVS